MRPPQNLEEAFVYIADCNLATVSGMAILKKRPKHEFGRQISIAQKMCDWMKDFHIDPKGTRAEEIIGKTTVEKWASQYFPPDKS